MYFSVPIDLPKKTVSYDWSDVYFLSESEQVPFADAKIITTKQEFQNNIHNQAIDIVLTKYPNWGYVNNKRAENFLRKTERELLKQCDGYVTESISILEDGTIKIVVDVDDTNSDQCVDKALNLFSMYSGQPVECYGDHITYTKDDFLFDRFNECEYEC